MLRIDQMGSRGPLGLSESKRMDSGIIAGCLDPDAGALCFPARDVADAGVAVARLTGLAPAEVAFDFSSQ